MGTALTWLDLLRRQAAYGRCRVLRVTVGVADLYYVFVGSP